MPRMKNAMVPVRNPYGTPAIKLSPIAAAAASSTHSHAATAGQSRISSELIFLWPRVRQTKVSARISATSSATVSGNDVARIYSHNKPVVSPWTC